MDAGGQGGAIVTMATERLSCRPGSRPGSSRAVSGQAVMRSFMLVNTSCPLPLTSFGPRSHRIWKRSLELEVCAPGGSQTGLLLPWAPRGEGSAQPASAPTRGSLLFFLEDRLCFCSPCPLPLSSHSGLGAGSPLWERTNSGPGNS